MAISEDFYKSTKGLTRRAGRGGAWRYLLEGRNDNGERSFVTVPIVESDTDRTAAKKVAKARVALEHKCHPPKDINKFIDLYAAQHSLKPSTIETYRFTLRSFSVEDEAHNTEAMNTLITSNRKRSTIHHAVARVKTFFTWLNTQGFELANPAVGIKIKDPQQPRTRIPTDEEVDIVRKWAAKREHTYPLSQLYVELLITTGARHSSVEALRVGDLREGRIYFTNVKCDRAYDVAIPAPADVVALWNDAAAGKRAKDLLIPQIDAKRIHRALDVYMGRRFGTDMNGETVSAHSFRHRVATIMLQAGVPIDAISKALDHKSIATTLHAYARHSQAQIDNAFSTVH